MTNGIRASLRIQLLAADTVVAESEDPILWQQTLAAISSGEAPGLAPTLDPPATSPALLTNTNEPVPDSAVETAAQKLADELELSRPVLEGALGPSLEPPYLHLDIRCWEALKKATPKSGPGAIAPLKIGATAAVLWFRAAKLGNPTADQAQAVLATIHARDSRPSRTLEKCDWLNLRGSSIVLNPAEVSQAEEIIRAFCEKRRPTPQKARGRDVR